MMNALQAAKVFALIGPLPRPLSLALSLSRLSLLIFLLSKEKVAQSDGEGALSPTSAGFCRIKVQSLMLWDLEDLVTVSQGWSRLGVHSHACVRRIHCLCNLCITP